MTLSSTETSASDKTASQNSVSQNAVSNSCRDRRMTIPNVICAVRLTGAFVLFGVALSGKASLFAGLFAALSLSDWIDGKLARWLNQRSDFGARLDSVADSVLYTALFFGSLWLRWDVLRLESVWWLSAIGSYLLTTLFGLWKYGRIPSYHTHGAKLSHWLILAGALSLLLDYSIWPFRIAMISVTLTNLEAIAISWCLKEWRADVLTVLHVFGNPPEKKF